MIIPTGALTVQCDQCGHQHTIPAEEADFEAVSHDERQMGEEIEYNWQPEIECDCGNVINVGYDAYEYPVGAFNAQDIQITGGTVVQEFGWKNRD
jgi:hypothetical protein